MGGIVPASGRRPRILTLQAVGDHSWSSGPLVTVTGFRERFIGLTPFSGGLGVILQGRSVHGRRMAHPLRVVGVDGAGVVLATSLLSCGGVVTVPGAVWMIELPPHGAVPPLGVRLTAAPIDTPTADTPTPGPHRRGGRALTG